MRVKSLLLVVVLNIFLSLALSVMFEYNDLQERITTMGDTITECLTMAVETSTGSEEVFSSEYQNKIGNSMYSFGETENAERTSNSLLMYDKDNNRCYYANVYMLAMHYTEYGRLPNNESEYKRIANDRDLNTTAGVYKYLFGQTGSVYSDSDLKWANTNKSIKKQIDNWNSGTYYESDKVLDGRKANSASFNASKLNSTATKEMNDFEGFYNSIGKDISTSGIVKSRDGSSYTAKEMIFPTLAQMGLSLSTLNRPTSNTTNDNFTSVTHFGKRKLSGAVQNSVYYLTPYSLGITYIPHSVLESTFVANLDMLARLQRVSSGYTEGTDSVVKAMKSATGCVETSVFALGGNEDLSAELDTDNAGGSRIVPVKHDSSVDEKLIVNDGQIEYDLSSVQTRIDYKLVDLYEDSNSRLLSALTGGVSAYDDAGNYKGESAYNLRLEATNKLIESDTHRKYGAGYRSFLAGERIVARISVRVKCHILYKSPILQWVSYGTRDTFDENHFDVKLINPSNGKVIEDEDGVWYQYTTYKVISR